MISVLITRLLTKTHTNSRHKFPKKRIFVTVLIPMNRSLKTLIVAATAVSAHLFSQYVPVNLTAAERKNAGEWVDKTYRSLSQDEKLGQLFIVALYTNKGEDEIARVRTLIEKEHLGGLILMQDDPAREITLLNEFQAKSKIPMLIGMDAEWGLYQRIPAAHKLPWAITLGAVRDKSIISEMAAKIAEDSHRMGINWDFAPVVDVNTNPDNPIIGNRSFGSDVGNVTESAAAYASGLQKSGILAAIKHFPGHGDTDTDSHLNLPAVAHNISRLNSTELAPFKALMDKGIGGVMVAHLYVPALEPQKGIPASLSSKIITGVLKSQLGYKGLIITDALNMGAVANSFKPGELDAMAFKAGNDIMLFSQGVAEGKALIKRAIDTGEIPDARLEESVKKILLTKYYLGLTQYQPRNPQNIASDLNTPAHAALAQKIYANALTLLKDSGKLLPLKCDETVYYVPLEEAPFNTFADQLNLSTTVIVKNADEVDTIPANSKVLVGFHKDNSTAYKPFKISDSSKKTLAELAQRQRVILTVFGSPYALKDVNLGAVSTVLVAYENNDDAMTATARAITGKERIHGRLPVLVNAALPYGSGIDLPSTTP